MNKHLIVSAIFLPMSLVTTSGVARMPGPPVDQQTRMTTFQQRFDSDGDGRVTREEIEAVRSADFEVADTDDDGNLSYAELNAFEQEQRVERLASEFASLDQDGSGGISADEFSDGHPQDRSELASRVLTLADTDEDGSLSLEELDALKQADPGPWYFANLDQNGDGVISQDEFTTAPSPRGPRHR